MNHRKRQKFIKKIQHWHSVNKPDLPWRKTKNPYHVLVSEVMLQKTQISRVLIKYPRFLKAFPTIQSLANAPLRRVLSVWQGMGYNRRGLYLQKAAKEIMQKHGGNVPKDVSLLDMLPGIGPYSARAIACFAYGACEPFIETNIRRVIIYEFFPRKKKVPDTEILQVLRQIQPPCFQREWYWALMDYGREGLKHIPNANRNSRHYVKQSKFEGSPRYIRAKIISYLLENKKATMEEIHASLEKDKYLTWLKNTDMHRMLVRLQNEHLIAGSKGIFRIV